MVHNCADAILPEITFNFEMVKKHFTDRGSNNPSDDTIDKATVREIDKQNDCRAKAVCLLQSTVGEKNRDEPTHFPPIQKILIIVKRTIQPPTPPKNAPTANPVPTPDVPLPGTPPPLQY